MYFFQCNFIGRTRAEVEVEKVRKEREHGGSGNSSAPAGPAALRPFGEGKRKREGVEVEKKRK